MTNLLDADVVWDCVEDPIELKLEPLDFVAVQLSPSTYRMRPLTAEEMVMPQWMLHLHLRLVDGGALHTAFCKWPTGGACTCGGTQIT
jgi:hypothetical protein